MLPAGSATRHDTSASRLTQVTMMEGGGDGKPSRRPCGWLWRASRSTLADSSVFGGSPDRRRPALLVDTRVGSCIMGVCS
jgi:hypothetical protein